MRYRALNIIMLTTLATSLFAQVRREDNRFIMFFAKDLDATAMDRNGALLAGTECNNIVAHDGKVWAAVSWMNPRDRQVDPKVLVKKSAAAGWEVDHSFGDTYSRIGMLKSVSFTTDARGNPLSPPARVLIAGLGQWLYLNFTDVRVASRNDITGRWHVDTLSHDPWFPDSSNDNNETRTVFDHVDRVTGIHHVFTGANNGSIYRGSYDATKPGLIAWDTIPEIGKMWGRTQCAAEANGVLYVGVVSQTDNPLAERGPLLLRIDGPQPRWEVVPIPAWLNPADTTKTTRMGGMRGLTSVKYSDGSESEFLLCFQTEPPIMEKIEPVFGYRTSTELDVRAFFTKEWGGSPGVYLVVGYNDMTPVRHPATGESALLMGAWLRHPDGESSELGKSSWYLIRDTAGRYSYSRIHAADDPLAVRTYGLRGTRAICPSPFPEEAGRIFYCGGFDQTGAAWGNHVWLYKGTLDAPSTGSQEAPSPHDQLTIHPNPCTNTLTVSNLSPQSAGTVVVSDLLGRIVSRAEYRGTSFQVDARHLVAGMYMIQLFTDNGRILTKTLVKQ